MPSMIAIANSGKDEALLPSLSQPLAGTSALVFDR